MTAPRRHYSSCVFLNCPFDEAYRPMLDALVFTIHACGFVPCSSLEESDSGNVRIEKIMRLISECKFGLHDISRTELDAHNGLPRFNMPLELGIFLGAKRFGTGHHRQKNCLVLDRERYRYQQFISDIAGHDIRAHEGKAEVAIAEVRSWLNDASGRTIMPGMKAINGRYAAFRKELPKICGELDLEVAEMTYNDYSMAVCDWLAKLPSRQAPTP